MSTATSTRPLGVENLEARRVMAGNVFVMHGNNALQIYGDTNDNQIVLTEVSPGTVRIAGLYNTTINGRLGEFTFKNPSDNLNIIMGRGHDYVSIGTDNGPMSRFDTLTVSTGSGRDNVVVTNTTSYGLAFSSFNLGDEYENDVDYFTLERSNLRLAAINTGGGDDWAYSANSTINKAMVNTGAGKDLLWLYNTPTDELYASLGAHDDEFRSWNSKPRTTRWVDGGDGNDTLLLGAESGRFANWQYLITGQQFETRKRW
jgi:hypothetical protein